jgi:anaerobic ribonucleoside-triphosphate reductase activating protein
LNYATVKTHDVANGPGVRVSLFVSGCSHHCKNCFNEEAWDYQYGEPYTPAVEQRILDALAPDYITGLSLLGGEPMDPRNQETVCALVRRVRETYPNKTIWCYSGYTLDEQLLAGKVGDPQTVRELLSMLDVLVDGRFVEEQKDLTLRFRGSANQRLIDVPKTLQTGKIVWWDESNEG